MYSVIVPTFNREPFLKRSIGSILDQDCILSGDIQIIIIDDGSTDNTEKIVADLIKQNPTKNEIVYIKLQHIGQPGTVRNKGLIRAEGDFIAYCDSDDFWLPHHLATAAQVFKKNPCLKMVSNFWGLAQFTLLPDGSIKNDYIVPPHDKMIVNTNCHVHKSECLGNIGEFNTSCWGEDQDFFSRIERTFPCYKTGIVTSVNGYIRGGNNLTYRFDSGIKQRYF